MAMSDSVAYENVGAIEADAAKNWYAVYTVSRHEKRIEEQLRNRAIENFLPVYDKQREWKDGSRGMLRLPLFSNYLFVRIGRGGRVPVLKVPGVRTILGFGPQPLPIADSYIQWLQESLQDRKIEPYPYLVAGAKVRIRSGAMAGMEGVLVRKKSNFRVVFTMEMISRSVTVEVELEDIEPGDRTSYVSEAQPAAYA
jgi:transcription antitermination factor NusG